MQLSYTQGDKVMNKVIQAMIVIGAVAVLVVFIYAVAWLLGVV